MRLRHSIHPRAIALAAALALVPASSAAAAPDPEALERRLGPGVNVVAGAETGAQLTFIGTDPGTEIALGPRAPRAAALEAAARFGARFGLIGEGALEIAEVDRLDDGRSAVRLQQTVAGIPVIGGELAIALDQTGDLLAVNGELSPQRDIDATPAIAAGDAARTALLSTARRHGVDATGLRVGDGELSLYDARILGGPGGSEPQLVWRFEVSGGDPVTIRDLVLVDAEFGAVALSFSLLNALDRRVCDAGSANANVPCLAEAAARSEGAGATGIADVDAAYDLTGQVYDFFQDRFGRDSIDGAGMTVISTVRFCETGCPYVNAFWNGAQMVYGTGMLTEDITGHELTHGVVEADSGLYYYYQSGAINESLADVFGELFDLTTASEPPDNPADRWLMGEGSAIGVIRNMADPPAFGHPDRTGSEHWYFDPNTGLAGAGDSGGVHYNSGVNNKAAYLLTDGGSFNGQSVAALGADKVLQLYYEVNANLLTSASDYQDLGNALRQACSNLTGEHGITATDCEAVDAAVLATEMDQPPSHDPAAAPRRAETCAPGEQQIDSFFDDLENPAGGNWSAGPVSGGENGFFYPQAPNGIENGKDFSATYATSGSTNIWGFDAAISADYAIAMTTGVTVPVGGRMHFMHAFGFDAEDGELYDGGVIEYSIDGGPWQDAGSLIVAGAAYTGTLNADSNPLDGRAAFSGESSGYGSSRLDLSTLAGREIRFRFRIGTDSSVYDYGWFIDDVRIYHCEAETDPGSDPVTQTDPQSQSGSSPVPSPAPAAAAPAQSPTNTTTKKKKRKKAKAQKCRRNQRKVRVKVKGKTKTKCVRRKGRAGKRR